MFKPKDFVHFVAQPGESFGDATLRITGALGLRTEMLLYGSVVSCDGVTTTILPALEPAHGVIEVPTRELALANPVDFLERPVLPGAKLVVVVSSALVEAEVVKWLDFKHLRYGYCEVGVQLYLPSTGKKMQNFNKSQRMLMPD